MNRAPGPNDFWWKEHQITCAGQFIKIKEPQKLEQKKKSSTARKISDKNNILNWIMKTNKNKKKTEEKDIPKIFNVPKITDLKNVKSNFVSNVQTNMKKLGNNINNVHGWGTGGPESTNDNNKHSTTNNKIIPTSSLRTTNSWIPSSGVLGGKGSGKSILLDKFSNTVASNTTLKNSSPIQSHLNQTNLFKNPIKNSNTKQNLKTVIKIRVNCPNCNKSVNESKINHHLDICLKNSEEPEIIHSYEDCLPNNIITDENKSSLVQIQCPLCPKKVEPDYFNEHLSTCFKSDVNERTFDKSMHDSSSNSIINDKKTLSNSLENTDSEQSSFDIFQNVVFNEFPKIVTASTSSKNSSSIQANLNRTNLHNKSVKNFNLNQHLENVKIMEVTCPNCNKFVCESKINNHLDICLKNSEDIKILPNSSNRKRKGEDSYKSNKKIGDCLQHDVDKTILDNSIHRPSSSSINLHNSPGRCLICDKILKPDASLSDHLEECVASIFNNSSNDCDDTIEITNDEEQVLSNFPCPVCMMPIQENLMNDHLDLCLKKIE
jgi:endogenous inhibitor of DNA gyrase (YacG/DUF329 family)